MGRQKKDDRFKLRTERTGKGKNSYWVEGYTLKGERIRKRFKFQTDAINYRAELETKEIENANVPDLQRTILTPQQISDAEAAVRNADGRSVAAIVSSYIKLEETLNKKHGITLGEAVGFTISHYRPDIEELSMMNARTRFLKSRRNIAAKTKDHYSNATNLLNKEQPNKAVHKFTVSDLEGALSKFSNPNTYQTYKRGLTTFFNWAVRHNHCLENPCHRLDKPPADITDISILSLDEVKRLLKAATLLHDGVMAAPVAILLFAGLRPSELKDLTKDNVKDDRIRVVGGKMRRKLKRSVPISSNLKTWLEKFPFSGCPKGWNYKYRILRKATKANNWVQDIARHTSISFQLDRDKDEGKVAFNNGTSVQMINWHYRDVIDDQKQVSEFWKLTPDKLKNVKVDFDKEHARQRTKEWPTDPELKKLVWEKPLYLLAKDLNCSDQAIRKRCLKRGIELPKNGHWQRVRAHRG